MGKKQGRMHVVSQRHQTRGGNCQIWNDFQKSFTGRLVIKYAVKFLKDLILNVLLHYLKKYMCSRNRRAQELSEANCHTRHSHTVMQDSAVDNNVAQKYLPSHINIT